MKYSLDISCNKERLREIRIFVGEILMDHDYPEVEVHKIILAVDEICANLMIHSNHCNPLSTLQLQVFLNQQDKLVIEIWDNGDGFDFTKYKEPTVEELVIAKKKGGLGLKIVNMIMDDIQFLKEKNKNICRLTKNIHF